MSHTTAAAASLPRDALASVLLRLPATDLHGCRRVCKEWREVIADPIFINEHMGHGPWALTHTIVFLRGRNKGETDEAAEPHKGHGFLFDQDWRLVARFTAGESEVMVGTCNGLLCFLDVRHGAINVVEPFTGESLAVPPPPKTDMLDEDYAYCFGFDPSSRRYTIFHLGLNLLSMEEDDTVQGLYVYTIGGGESWRRVPVARTAEGWEFNRDPVLADGSLYWFVDTKQLAKLACFDLATGEITSISFPGHFLPMDDQGTAFQLTTDSDARMCVMTVGAFGEWEVFFMGEDGRWTQNNYSGRTLAPERQLTSRQALQRGQLLLQDNRECGLYAHPIEPAGHDLGSGKLLLKIGRENRKEPAKSNRTRVLFVRPVPPLDQVPEMVVPYELSIAATYCYAPPVSPAPLAQRWGLPCEQSCK